MDSLRFEMHPRRRGRRRKRTRGWIKRRQLFIAQHANNSGLVHMRVLVGFSFSPDRPLSLSLSHRLRLRLRLHLVL